MYVPICTHMVQAYTVCAHIIYVHVCECTWICESCNTWPNISQHHITVDWISPRVYTVTLTCMHTCKLHNSPYTLRTVHKPSTSIHTCMPWLNASSEQTGPIWTCPHTVEGHSGLQIEDHSGLQIEDHSGLHIEATNRGSQWATNRGPQWATNRGSQWATNRGLQWPHRGPQWAPHRGPQWAPHRGPQWATNRGPQWATNRGSQWAPHRGPQWAPHRGPQWATNRGPQWATNRGSQWAPQRLSSALPSPLQLDISRKQEHSNHGINCCLEDVKIGGKDDIILTRSQHECHRKLTAS